MQNQNTVILFLLESDQETIVVAFVATAFCLKFVEVVHLILRQVTPCISACSDASDFM